MKNRGYILSKDLIIIVFSVLVAFLIVRTGILKNLLISTQEIKLIGSFVAGLFFTSIFTVAPATVVLAQMAQTNSIFTVAFLGGIGALLGDLIIFRFIKNNLSNDLAYLVKITKSEKLLSVFKLRLFKWLIPFIGALVIASPLPDEIGLTMMGLSKVRTSLFIPISFTLNFLGILIIGIIAKSI